jgi:aryl-alcohol dehydrogenase-like predicted oxidoreductase
MPPCRQVSKDLGIARKDVIVATKVRGRMGPGPNDVGLTLGHILDAVKDSLDRLGTDHIDLYQIHGVDSATPIEETLRALDDLVRSGQNIAAAQLTLSTDDLAALDAVSALKQEYPRWMLECQSAGRIPQAR